MSDLKYSFGQSFSVKPARKANKLKIIQETFTLIIFLKNKDIDINYILPY